jgi:hypothetical protein
MTEEVKIITEQKKRGKPRIYPEGVKQHEKDSKYHQQYYHLTNKPTNCEICGKKTTLRTLTQHQRGLRCQLVHLQKCDVQPNLNKDTKCSICNKVYKGNQKRHEETVRCQIARIQLEK